MTPRTNDGFTLIELIVVIAVLAILAAVALPKFADFSTSAENAAFDGVVGGFTAGIGITHAKWLADNKPTVGVFLDGATVQVNAAGWPTLDSAGAGTQGTADELWGLVMAGSQPVRNRLAPVHGRLRNLGEQGVQADANLGQGSACSRLYHPRADRG